MPTIVTVTSARSSSLSSSRPCQCQRRSSSRASSTSRSPTTSFFSILFAVFLATCAPVPVSSFLLAMSSLPSAGGLKDIGSSVPTTTSTTSASSSSSSSIKWMQDLQTALDKNSAEMHSRFMQLATVTVRQDNENLIRPHVRWVVFRGFFPTTTTIKIITDSRSEKCVDLTTNPFAELSWYFVASREQFRLAGKVQLVTAAETDASLVQARLEQWNALSDNARVQFWWPMPGEEEKEGMTEEERKDLFNPSVPSSSSPPPPPPDTFVLLLFHPVHVDHLQLRPNPQIRMKHDLDSSAASGMCVKEDGKEEGEEVWTTKRVNP